MPTLEIGPPDDFGPFDHALKNLAQYQWLIFTSANGVAAFMDRLFEQGRDVRALGGLKIAAIGPATAESLRAYGLKADVVPPAFKAEVLLEALGPQVTPGSQNAPGPGPDRPGGAAGGLGAPGGQGGRGPGL